MIPVIYKKGSFLDTLKYVLEKDDAAIIDTNMMGTSPGELNLQFLANRYLNKGVTRACAHHIIAIAHREGHHEHLWDSQYGYVVGEYLKEMGYCKEGEALSQYVAVRHCDRNHEHVHIIASRITLDGKTVSDSHDYFKAQETTRKIAAALGLEITPTSNQAIANKLDKEYGITAAVSSNRSKSIRQVNSKHKTPSAKEIIKQGIAAAVENKPDVGTFIQRLGESGVQVLPKLKGKELLGFSYIHNSVVVAGYQIYKPYSWKNLQTEFGMSYNPETDYDTLVRARTQGQELLLKGKNTSSTTDNSDDSNSDSHKNKSAIAFGNKGNQQPDENVVIPVLLKEGKRKKWLSVDSSKYGEKEEVPEAEFTEVEEDTNVVSQSNTEVKAAPLDTTSTEKFTQLELLDVKVPNVKQTNSTKRDSPEIGGKDATSFNLVQANLQTTDTAENQPSEEDKHWAESILPAVGKIWRLANQTGKIKLIPGGTKQVEGRSYRITIKDERLSISFLQDNRKVASYDLEKNTVLAASPTDEDKQYWKKITQKQSVSINKKDVEL
ncbi:MULTISPECIES: relaxase/mobilization nuclease domain-containing protein [Brasilonema]|uniref:relaxase/mobilization nuclease domain-containing protein n=1 Tax=Brasilonema TaxID=383614 RepID=UPI001FEAE7AE|nr:MULTISPECIES: relaxase/mobilization nuclease domain-containing protein [Brasilonema]